MRKSKYNARKLVCADGSFDSKKEYKRFKELSEMLNDGRITKLSRQIKYELIPHQLDSDGRVIERAVEYRADFVYTTADGIEIVEDVKGFKTPEYVIKRKLMLERYGIRIREV